MNFSGVKTLNYCSLRVPECLILLLRVSPVVDLKIQSFYRHQLERSGTTSSDGGSNNRRTSEVMEEIAFLKFSFIYPDSGQQLSWFNMAFFGHF